MKNTIRTEHGTLEILGYEGTFSAPQRVERWTPDDGARPCVETTRCTGAGDMSPRHRHNVPGQYSARCGLCYLNITHTAELHARTVAS
jgi:hypothetical protein